MYQVIMVVTTVHTTMVITMARDRLRMSLLPQDQTLTPMLMAGVSYFYSNYNDMI